MFNTTPKNVDARIAVMEEKFNIYEKMMDKLESAIHTISEINQNISRMLMVHEEKLDANVKSDINITDKLKSIQEQSIEDNQKLLDLLEKFDSRVKLGIQEETEERKQDISEINKKIDSIEQKIEGITKFRWLIAGGLAVLVFLSNNISSVIGNLTFNNNSDSIERTK